MNYISLIFGNALNYCITDLLADDLSSLTYGLGMEMPSINDVDGNLSELQDRIGDASLDPEEALVDTTVSSELNVDDDEDDDVYGVPTSSQLTGFRQSADNESDSDADVDSFAAGLAFSDDLTDTVDAAGDGDKMFAGIGGALLGGILSQGHSKLSAALTSTAISGIVSGASSGFSAIRDVVKRASLSTAAQSSSEDATGDSDVIDAEFEFLNREELEQADSAAT
jgi:hypothetical protein